MKAKKRILQLGLGIAAAASLCFSGLVDLLMLRRLHRINMAESLKAAD